MSARQRPTTLLYPLMISALFHLAILWLVAAPPPDQAQSPTEPALMDLTDAPEPVPAPPGPEPAIKRIARITQRVVRETAPRGTRETERLPRDAARPVRPSRARLPGESPAAQNRERGPGGMLRDSGGAARPGELPGSGKLARLKESYLKKYQTEVAEGETKFLNTDDVEFGSFLRRFETEVQQVWHYPRAAALRQIEGVTPVRITFKRGGEIVQVELLQSSGSRILDDEVLRCLKQLGPIGSFPKGYQGVAFKLVAFFEYGIGGGRLR